MRRFLQELYRIFHYVLSQHVKHDRSSAKRLNVIAQHHFQIGRPSHGFALRLVRLPVCFLVLRGAIEHAIAALALSQPPRLAKAELALFACNDVSQDGKPRIDIIDLFQEVTDR